MDGQVVVADLLGNAPEWQERALCAQTDPEAFFPEKGGSTKEAKRICAGCEVRAECLEYALANDERFGIWGGLSERERRKLKRLGSSAFCCRDLALVASGSRGCPAFQTQPPASPPSWSCTTARSGWAVRSR